MDTVVREYAEKRVRRLKDELQDLNDICDRTPAEQKKIASVKTSLRRWLKEFPGLDDSLLNSISRKPS